MTNSLVFKVFSLRLFIWCASCLVSWKVKKGWWSNLLRCTHQAAIWIHLVIVLAKQEARWHLSQVCGILNPHRIDRVGSLWMFVDVCGKGDPTLIQPVLCFRPRRQSFEPLSCTIARKHRTASRIASVLRQQGVSVRCAPGRWKEPQNLRNHFSSVSSMFHLIPSYSR